MTEKTEQPTEAQQGAPEPNELPAYRSFKVVRAAKIAGFEFEPTADPQLVRLQFDCEDGPRGVIVEDTWLLTRVRPSFKDASEDKEPVTSAAEKAVGGYYVAYEDGYSSWSPADAFETGYMPLIDQEPTPVAEATLSERPFDFEDFAVTTIPNGHDGGGAHADVTLDRVVDNDDPYKETIYSLAGGAGGMLEMQSGPAAEVGANGFTIENLLSVVIDRLTLFQQSEFSCHENKMAIHYARLALGELNARTARRIERGVEGTNQV